VNIVCVGGLPAGLYFALLARLRHPQHTVTVLERSSAGQTFGWGVVLSDAALDTLALADAHSAAAVRAAFKRWDAIEIHVRGRTIGAGGAPDLSGYQAARQVAVLKLQSAARNAMDWFENVARYSALEPEQFAYSLLTRSQRLGHENLRLRDPACIGGFEQAPPSPTRDVQRACQALAARERPRFEGN